jgi:hypothetical protein
LGWALESVLGAKLIDRLGLLCWSEMSPPPPPPPPPPQGRRKERSRCRRRRLGFGLVALAVGLLQLQGAGASTQAMTGKMMNNPNMTGSHASDAR